MIEIEQKIGKEENRPLPDGWRWVKLSDICDLNPRRPFLNRPTDAPTAFVPMSSVEEAGRGISSLEFRPFSRVQSGYTYFAEGDVLFAKITPCMQNGKHAIAENLSDGIGFGSTEFHVIRPTAEVISEWIHWFLLQSWILRRAEAYFTGAVGQQRVPQSYLENLRIPLPPLSEQHHIAARLREQMAAVEQARIATEAQLKAAGELAAAYLRNVFENPEVKQWPMKRLGEILHLRKEVVHPRDNPHGRTAFVGLENIESGNGVRTGAKDVEMSELTGRKPRFYKGDIVYGYLRPYLNKVWIAEFEGLCSVDQYVYSVVREEADTDFVAWFMRSTTYLNRAPIDTTPGQLPRIRTEEVASVEINLPPLAKQQRLVAKLSEQMIQLEQIRRFLTEQLDAINQLPNVLLRRAFSGEL